MLPTPILWIISQTARLEARHWATPPTSNVSCSSQVKVSWLLQNLIILRLPTFLRDYYSQWLLARQYLRFKSSVACEDFKIIIHAVCNYVHNLESDTLLYGGFSTQYKYILYSFYSMKNIWLVIWGVSDKVIRILFNNDGGDL